MQVTRLDTDMIALMILLEKNRGSILKILVDIGMPLEDENAEWEEIVDFALQYIAEKKAVGFFLYKLSEIVLGITKTIYWTEAIAVRYLQYVQNKGLLKTCWDERRRGKRTLLSPCSMSPRVGADRALQSMWMSAVLDSSNMEAVAEW